MLPGSSSPLLSPPPASQACSDRAELSKVLLGLLGPQESEREAHLTHPMLNLAGHRTNPASVSWCVAHLCHVTFLRVTVVVFSGEAVGRPLVLERTLVWGGFGRGSLGPACSGGEEQPLCSGLDQQHLDITELLWGATNLALQGSGFRITTAALLP